MSNIIKVDPKQFGVAETKAQEIELAFTPYVEAMEALQPELDEFIKGLDFVPTEDECARAAELRKQYVKIRTGTGKAHKEQKAVFLNAGRFVDGLKNAQKKAGDEIEAELERIEKFHINLERDRLSEIHLKRYEEIKEFLIPGTPTTDYSLMSDDIWKTFLAGTKIGYQEHIRNLEKDLPKVYPATPDEAFQKEDSDVFEVLVTHKGMLNQFRATVKFGGGKYLITEVE